MLNIIVNKLIWLVRWSVHGCERGWHVVGKEGDVWLVNQINLLNYYTLVNQATSLHGRSLRVEGLGTREIGDEGRGGKT